VEDPTRAPSGSGDDAPTTTVRVLHVDDPAVAETTAAALTDREGWAVVVEPTPGEALARLADGAFDCVVTDYDLPEMDGLAFHETARDRGHDVPFVLFTGDGDESVASRAFAAGVADYVRKDPDGDRHAVLAARVANAVERHRSRRALEESQKRLSLFVEQSPLGVLEYDENFAIVGVNPAGEAILGYDEADLVGETWEALVTTESYENVDRVTDELARGEGGWHSVDENVRADGQHIVCEWHNRVVTDDDGDVVAVFSQFQDVTERVEREARLERTTVRLEEVTNRYEALVRAFPDGGVFMFDGDLAYTVAGGQGLSAVGLTTEDFIGRTPFDLFPERVAEVTARYYRRTLAGERHTYEIEYDGACWRVLTIPIEGYDGVVSGMAVSQDVTEQKRRIDRLNRQKERLEEFASLVSHDLRNPLNVAEGRLELARVDGDESHLDAVSEAHARMRTMIEDLLTLARAETEVDTETPQSLAAVATAAWRSVETGAATLETPADATVLADRSRLQRLFENLIRNAVEHGAADATVTVGLLDDGRGFFVADDGPGVPPDRRDAVFEAGYSTGAEGTGFGLRIVERVAAAHGWTADLTESATGGARFEFRGLRFVEG
jgi:PAS domain S-box-containing protein